MPFHVEVSSGHNHARIFNIDAAELRETVLEPWVRGQQFKLGEKEWDPRESNLKVLEGVALEGPDLAFGQGWSNALSSAEDVTRTVTALTESTATVPEAFVLGSASGAAAIRELHGGLEPQPIHYSEAMKRLDGRDPEIAAVILVLRRSESEPQQS